MTTIKLEIPSNDPVAMFHMGEALRNIAKENGYVVQDSPQQRVTTTETVVNDTEQYAKAWSEHYGDTDMKMSGLMNHPKSSLEDILDNPPAATDELKELLSPHVTVVEYEPDSDNVTTTTSDELIDADGLPHDKRIHSKGATRLNDDTWRMKKKPADKTDEEWAEFVDGVKAELKQLMDIPVATGEAGISVEDITQAEINVGNLTPPTLDELAVADREQVEPQPIVLPPIKNPFEASPVVNNVTPPIVVPPVIVPPVTVTPPTDSDVPTTFPLFMKFITSNNKKLTNDMVNEVLNNHDIKSLPLLFSRVDLIPQIHAELVKLL